jgi:pimeloyl-ACP methyl ester carboxylesterase
MATTTPSTATETFVELAGGQVHLLRGGTGDPLLVLHHDIGNPGWLPFYQDLARRFTVYVPSHPGYGQSARPNWMRSVRDVAIVYQWLLADLQLEAVSLVGLGFGGWIAAEMATMAPRDFRRLVLVGAMGLQPTEGEIFDQSLVSYIDYARAGFSDQSKFDQLFGSEPSTDQLEAWDIHREMTFRIAWKPYMYSQTLPHLLGGVRMPALVVWGSEDRIVPPECGERYARSLPNARLELIEACGHFVEMERPTELAKLVLEMT